MRGRRERKRRGELIAEDHGRETRVR
jgi:hypothetical protein